MSDHIPEFFSLASILAEQCGCHRKDSESEWLAKDNLETNPITIKPETASHLTEQFSWVPLPYCFPPRCLFPIKSLALSTHVSPWTIHFRVLDKSPVLGPGRDPPSCNRTIGKQSENFPWSKDSFTIKLFSRKIRVLSVTQGISSVLLSSETTGKSLHLPPSPCSTLLDKVG